MRESLVTETYYPQVNGVSRTLGELVRHLTERGDLVQLIHPNYGEPAGRSDVHLVRSVNVPFYKELYLPLPPFGSVRRAIDMFRPEVVHIATEATLGLTLLRHVLRRKMVTVSSFHTNFDQYSRHYRIGWANG
ncbi:MAG: glycosyltransferase, partial [Isosphaeraceae bacterium]